MWVRGFDLRDTRDLSAALGSWQMLRLSGGNPYVSRVLRYFDRPGISQVRTCRLDADSQ